MKKAICKIKKHIAFFLLCCTSAYVFLSNAPVADRTPSTDTFQITEAEAAAKKNKSELPSKLYKKIKGWWADNSSGGYDRKITKTYIKAYHRDTGKLAYKSKIYGWKKTDQGYLIRLKYPHNHARYCYLYNEQYDSLDYYYDVWKADGNYYSGSASLSRISEK